MKPFSVTKITCSYFVEVGEKIAAMVKCVFHSSIATATPYDKWHTLNQVKHKH